MRLGRPLRQLWRPSRGRPLRSIASSSCPSIESFQRDGFVVCENLFTRAEMKECKAEMDTFMAMEAPQVNDRGSKFEDSGVWERIWRGGGGSLWLSSTSRGRVSHLLPRV